MTNLYEAHEQWAKRPPDERFGTLDELHAFTLKHKEASIEKAQRLDDVTLIDGNDGSLHCESTETRALFTNWSFGQLCRTLSAPANYIRTLPSYTAASCLNYGLRRSVTECKLLYREPIKGASPRFLSAFTSPTYGRIWDADVVAHLAEAVKDTGWRVPPASDAHGSQNAGLYASDRDVFVFLVNDENPVEVENARLGRGFFCWNSEVGSATLGVMTFLYNYVCGNHVVWGAEEITELKIIHRSKAPERFIRDVIPALNRFVANRATGSLIKDRVSNAMQMKLGNDSKEIESLFRARPFTRHELQAAWNTAQSDGEDPTRLWGMVQGLTSYARTLPHANLRVDLERRAGALLN